MKRLLLILSLSLGITSLANAGELTYECTVQNLYEQSDSGEIKLSPDIWQEIYDGQKFTVYKKTGLMSGDFDTSQLSDSRVVNQGSSGNSFKAVNFTYDERKWLILEIKTHFESEKKPFIMLYQLGILTGFCK